MNKKTLPSPALLRNLLRYEPETGLLFWKVRTPELCDQSKKNWEHSLKVFNSRFSGKKAFEAITKLGYKRSNIGKSSIMAHRIIWAICYGEYPSFGIDHIDGCRTNNRIKNLRDVNQSENTKNIKLKNSNRSGFNGVSFTKRNKKWSSSINFKGKQIWLGYFNKKEDAISARKEANIKYGYHANHGNR